MAAMKALLRTLLIWLLLAGVPLQGFAASTMLLCAPPAAPMAAVPAAVMDEHHDHAAMVAAQQHASHGENDSPGHHGQDAKCAGAAFCCTGAPLATRMPMAPALPDAGSAPIPFETTAPAAVDLAGIERPPKRLHA